MSRVEGGSPDADGAISAGARPVDLTEQIRFLERRIRAAAFEALDADQQQALAELLETVRGLVKPTAPG
jgi:hypothetical protein